MEHINIHRHRYTHFTFLFWDFIRSWDAFPLNICFLFSIYLWTWAGKNVWTVFWRWCIIIYMKPVRFAKSTPKRNWSLFFRIFFILYFHWLSFPCEVLANIILRLNRTHSTRPFFFCRGLFRLRISCYSL